MKDHAMNPTSSLTLGWDFGRDPHRRSGGFSTLARRLSRALARRHRVASTRRALLHLDDHALRDIGLHRGDLYMLGNDALSAVLEGRASHRHRFELELGQQ